MEILSFGTIEHHETDYYGKCQSCGSTFKARIHRAVLQNGSKRYIPVDPIYHFSIAHNGSPLCECPVCGWPHVTLNATE